MTVTYSMAPAPKWYIANNLGTAAGGAKMYTKRQLNKDQDKPVYQDPNGAFPYSNPVRFDLNGTQGPFFWEFDTTQTDDLYYLYFTDANDNFLYDIENFSPFGSGGGSGTTYANLKNLIVNNVFWRNIGTSATPVPNLLTICPSAHSAFETPDIIFSKTATANSDNLSFPKFTLGSDPFGADLTPNWYMRYQCTTNVPGETDKFVQFPIIAKVNNLDNTNVTFTIWTQNAGAGGNITVQLMQYFGSGGAPSATVLSATQLINVTTTWTKTTLNFTIPNTSGKTLGTCDNDGLYLKINYPLSQQCDISIAKPALYLGNITPSSDLDTYDEVDSIINADRVGTTKTGYMSTPLGYILANDGTIGSSSSVATTRANSDTYFLFKEIYNNVADIYAPVSGGRSGNPSTDFAANKTLRLPLMLGRGLGVAGSGSGLTNRDTGQPYGVETVGLSGANNGPHIHAGSGTLGFLLEPNGSTGGTTPLVSAAVGGNTLPVSVTINSSGSGTPHENMPPMGYQRMFIKL